MLHEGIQFAKEHILIITKDVEVIFHARTSVLYNDGEPYVKKQGGSFDVTRRACDEGKVCEFYGNYMSYLIWKKYNSKTLAYLEMAE